MKIERELWNSHLKKAIHSKTPKRSKQLFFRFSSPCLQSKQLKLSLAKNNYRNYKFQHQS